ncbi:MAG: hypothetical protein M1296_01000 [Chloroflexi bacterium]|nr:hypothetical protein [Chloroflexota bacterium]
MMTGNSRGVFSLATVRSLSRCVAQLCSEQPAGIAETVSLHADGMTALW